MKDLAGDVVVPGIARSVPELVAEGLTSHFGAPAAEFEGRRMGRAELAERSDRLAVWLRSHGAGSGSLVGVSMERSLELLIAILGVMKAGAAYVPLDPGFPSERNARILAETKVPVLLTLSRHSKSLPESGARVVFLDDDAEVWRTPGRPGPKLLPAIAPEMRAYVIFTSGSTGQPKGVEVTHGSVVNLLRSAVEVLGAGADERLVAITTLAFDISVLELLLPLVCGGTVVIANQAEASDALRLKELLKSSRATMLQGTPGTFRSLLELGFESGQEADRGLGRRAAIRPEFKMLCGGEAWDQGLAERLLATGARVWNMYGPTETTVWSSMVEVCAGATRMTFGPPIEGTRFYVLDEAMAAVPRRGQGELWIAGVGVARGYFERPELTAERFLADPWVAGERMYRTGDEVRLLEGGALEFVGRLDEQVKLRGFRIELGEIAATMRAVRGVREAVAVLRRGARDEEMLAGFYVAGPEVREEEMRAALGRTLPEYMVPRALVRLDALPRTPNGKTDRRALAAMEIARGEKREGVAADTTQGVDTASVAGAAGFEVPAEIERKMLAIWRKLFPGESITAESDFFDLGGDSLLVVRLQSLLASEFGVRLTMADATQFFTLSGHVGWVRAVRAGVAESSTAALRPAVLPLQRAGTGAPIFIIPQMLNFRLLAEELGREQPVYGLQIMEEDVTEAMASASFEDLAAIYCGLIREVQPEGPYRLAGWCLWGWMAYEVARQLEAAGAEVEVLAIIDAWAPGYWERYSPVRQFLVNASHFGQRIKEYADSLRGMPLRDSVRDGARRVRETGTDLVRLLPRGLRPAMPVVEMLPIQQYASKAAESYRPGPLKGNVVVFKSELRPTGQFIGEDMGWSAILGRTVRLDTLPGNHNDIFTLPSARLIASRVRSVLGLKGVEQTKANADSLRE